MGVKLDFFFHMIRYLASLKPMYFSHPSCVLHVLLFLIGAICTRCGPGSVVGIATAYGLDGPGDRIPVRIRFSAPVQTGPKAHPASYTMGTGSFPGVKRPGRGVDHPPPSNVEVEGRVELYLYSLSGSSWPVVG